MLGNRAQHALRAFTPRDQKAIRAAAETFRINPDLDVETAVTELRVGEEVEASGAEEVGKAIGIPGLGRFARNLIGGLMR